jgi:hypothetical protein
MKIAWGKAPSHFDLSNPNYYCAKVANVSCLIGMTAHKMRYINTTGAGVKKAPTAKTLRSVTSIPKYSAIPAITPPNIDSFPLILNSFFIFVFVYFALFDDPKLTYNKVLCITKYIDGYK